MTENDLNSLVANNMPDWAKTTYAESGRYSEN